MGYDAAFNLTKVWNKALNFDGLNEDEDPFKQFKIMELNEADNNEIDKIRLLEMQKAQADDEIRKAKHRLEQKQLYDLQEKES